MTSQRNPRVWRTRVRAFTEVMFLYPPGVYRAQSDSDLVADEMRSGYAAGRHVLDVGTGSGALAVAAAGAGAASVTAVDLSRRAVATARLNSLLHGAAVTVHRGDLFAPVQGRRFGLIIANPPYVPAPTAELPRHRMARCWDAGRDGRALLDRICAGARDRLEPGGDLLLVHSAVCDPDATVDVLGRHGLTARVLRRAVVPFGPVMRARAAMLETRGLIRSGQDTEELVVIGARRG